MRCPVVPVGLRGLPTFAALHLIKTALLPKMLWASPVSWTGSRHILDRLELAFHRALRWAPGPPKFVANRNLFLLTHSPPLQCMLDHLSTCYTICLLFAGKVHALHPYIRLPYEEVSQSLLLR